jgi:hypothetical protein
MPAVFMGEQALAAAGHGEYTWQELSRRERLERINDRKSTTA